MDMARYRDAREEAHPSDTDVPLPPAPLGGALQMQRSLRKCWSKGCRYLMHALWEQNDWGHYCCGDCGDADRAAGGALAHAHCHGDKCVRVLVPESRRGLCSTPGCPFRVHSNPAKIREFGHFCCRRCRRTLGEECGECCEGRLLQRDLARGDNVVVEASSNKKSHLPANVVDGSRSTHWSSEEGRARSSHLWSERLEVDLGKSHHISHIVVIWEATYAKSYVVEGLGNGTWQTLASTVGHEGLVVTNLDGGCWRKLCIRMWEPATRFGVSIRELSIYRKERCSEQAAELMTLCTRGLLSYLDSLKRLSMACCKLLGQVHEFQSVLREPSEDGPPQAADLPEYQRALEALGVEPTLLAQSRLHRSWQGINEEFRRSPARHGCLADPAIYIEAVLEKAICKAFQMPSGQAKPSWKHVTLQLRRSGALGEEEVVDCNVYEAVRKLLAVRKLFSEGCSMASEPFPSASSSLSAFALDLVCRRELPSGVRAALEDLCHCAQLAASPVEQVLSLGHCLFERALKGSGLPPARFYSDFLDTWEGAMQKFKECMDLYMDEHKEKAFMSAFAAPADYYLRQVKEDKDPVKMETWLRYGQNFYRALLHSTLGIQMPWTASHAALGPQVLDLWKGLSDEAQKVFKREQHFGIAPPPKELEALGSGHITKFCPPVLFRSRRPAEHAKALGSRERERMSKYLEHFAHFFQASLFARLALQAIERERMPEYRGGRRAVETLYACWLRPRETLGGKEDAAPEAEASVWDYLYPDGREQGMSAERAQQFLLSFKCFEVLRPACPGGQDMGKRLLDQKADETHAALVIQHWYFQVRQRCREAPVQGSTSSELNSEGASWCSAPPTLGTQACLLPGTLVIGDRGQLLGTGELRQGAVLKSGRPKAEVRKVNELGIQGRDLYEIEYKPSSSQDSGGWTEVLQVTKGQFFAARKLGEQNPRDFKKLGPSELIPGDRLRGPAEEEFEILRCVPMKNQMTGCIEVFLEDPRSTFFAGKQGTPKEHFVELYGEQELEPKDYVIRLRFQRNNEFERLFLKSQDLCLNHCMKQLENQGYSSDLGKEYGFAKMFVEPYLAHKVMNILDLYKPPGMSPRVPPGLSHRVIFVSRYYYRRVLDIIKQRNVWVRSQKTGKKRKEAVDERSRTRPPSLRYNFTKEEKLVFGTPGPNTRLSPHSKPWGGRLLRWGSKSGRLSSDSRVRIQLIRTFVELNLQEVAEHHSIVQSDGIREYSGSFAAMSRSQCQRRAALFAGVSSSGGGADVTEELGA